MNELIQLGLPKGKIRFLTLIFFQKRNFSLRLEHANGFVKVYEEFFDRLTEKLRSSILRRKFDRFQIDRFSLSRCFSDEIE